MEVTRRGALGLLFAAPAIVKIGSLMPVKVIMPEPVVHHVDGAGWHHYLFAWDDERNTTVVWRNGTVIETAIPLDDKARGHWERSSSDKGSTSMWAKSIGAGALFCEKGDV